MPGTRSKRWTLVASALALLTSGVAAPRASAQTPEVTAPATTMTPPRVTKFVEAKRPDTTPAEGAAVDIELTIAADGTLTDAKVVGSAGDELDAAALEAVKQFTFEPARKGDKPIPARIRYRYTFDPTPVPAPAAPDAAAGADAAAVPAAAAAPRPGRLDGRVLAAKGEVPIPGATITLLSEHGISVGTTLAAEDGTFAFAGVAPGAVHGAHRSGRLPDRRDTGGRDRRTRPRRSPIAWRRARKSGTEYEFGATASIAAPPREVVKRTLTPVELVNTAGTRGDPLRVIELFPGVARPPGLAGFIIIRGSSPFDSQAYFEKGEVDRIYHFGGLTSFVNPRLLDHIDLYPGNFSARYGRKTGGIIDVGIRDPKTDALHVMADVNLIDASFIAEGPVGKRGSFALAAKRSYIDFWFNNVVPQDVIGVTAAPVYYDYQAVYTYRPESGGKVRTMFLGSGDEFRLNLKQPADGDPTLRGNFGARHRVPPAADDLAAQHRRATSSRTSPPASGQSTRTWRRATRSGSASRATSQFLRAEWRAQLGSHVQADRRLRRLPPSRWTSLTSDRCSSRPRATRATSPARSPACRRRRSRAGTRRYRPAGYLEAVIQAGERLTLVPGVRVDYFSDIEKGSVNPRLTARFKLAPETTLKGGVGLFSQPPDYGETVAPVGNPNLGLSQAQHYGLGVEQSFGPVGSVSLEGFYKRLSDLEVNGVGPDGNPLLVNGGKGRIYGLEVLAKLNPTGRAFGFVSYTLSRSERNDYGAALAPVRLRPDAHPDADGRLRFGRGWDVGEHVPPGQRQPAHADRRQRLRREQRLLQPGLRRGEQRARSAVPPGVASGSRRPGSSRCGSSPRTSMCRTSTTIAARKGCSTATTTRAASRCRVFRSSPASACAGSSRRSHEPQREKREHRSHHHRPGARAPSRRCC